MTTAKTNVLILAVLVLIGGYVVLTVGATIDIEEMQDFNDRAEEWCDAEGGDLYTANVMGAHGGLHCTDGESMHIHMADVSALNWTHDHQAIHERFEERSGIIPGTGGLLTPVVAAVVIAVLVTGVLVVVRRFRG